MHYARIFIDQYANIQKHTRADPGFVVRGSASRRGVWGPLKIPSGSKAELSPPDIYLNDNFKPTTPFLSDQNNLTLSLNFVG